MSAIDDQKPVRQTGSSSKKKAPARKASASRAAGESKPKPKRKYVTRKTGTRRTAAAKAKAATPAKPVTPNESGASATTAEEISRQRIKAALSGSVRAGNAEPTGNGRSRPVADATPAAAPRGVTREERQRMIAERAYELAQARGFRNGNPVEDWLTAESEIDAAILRSAAES